MLRCADAPGCFHILDAPPYSCPRPQCSLNTFQYFPHTSPCPHGGSSNRKKQRWTGRREFIEMKRVGVRQVLGTYGLWRRLGLRFARCLCARWPLVGPGGDDLPITALACTGGVPRQGDPFKNEPELLESVGGLSAPLLTKTWQIAEVRERISIAQKLPPPLRRSSAVSS